MSVTFLTPEDLAAVQAKLLDHDTKLSDHETRIAKLEAGSVEPPLPPDPEEPGGPIIIDPSKRFINKRTGIGYATLKEVAESLRPPSNPTDPATYDTVIVREGVTKVGQEVSQGLIGVHSVWEGENPEPGATVIDGSLTTWAKGILTVVEPWMAGYTPVDIWLKGFTLMNARNGNVNAGGIKFTNGGKLYSREMRYVSCDNGILSSDVSSEINIQDSESYMCGADSRAHGFYLHTEKAVLNNVRSIGVKGGMGCKTVAKRTEIDGFLNTDFDVTYEGPVGDGYWERDIRLYRKLAGAVDRGGNYAVGIDGGGSGFIRNWVSLEGGSGNRKTFTISDSNNQDPNRIDNRIGDFLIENGYAVNGRNPAGFLAVRVNSVDGRLPGTTILVRDCQWFLRAPWDAAAVTGGYFQGTVKDSAGVVIGAAEDTGIPHDAYERLTYEHNAGKMENNQVHYVFKPLAVAVPNGDPRNPFNRAIYEVTRPAGPWTP